MPANFSQSETNREKKNKLHAYMNEAEEGKKRATHKLNQ